MAGLRRVVLAGARATLRIGTTATCIGRGATVYRGLGAALRLEDDADVALEGLAIQGTGTGRWSPIHYCQHGVQVLTSSGVTLRDLHVSRVWGDCFYLGAARPGRGAVDSTDVAILDSTCTAPGREGASITNARRVTFERDRFIDVRRNGITTDENGPTNDAFDVSILHCTFVGPGISMVNMAAGGGRPQSGFLVLDNRCQAGDCGIRAKDVSNVTIAGNRVVSQGGFAVVWVTGSRDVTIRGNIMPCVHRPRPEALLELDGEVQGLTVVGNSMAGCRLQMAGPYATVPPRIQGEHVSGNR